MKYLEGAPEQAERWSKRQATEQATSDKASDVTEPSDERRD